MQLVIKKQVITEVEEVIEYDLPAFRKYTGQARIDADRVINVKGDEITLYNGKHMVEFFLKEGKTSTKAAFDNAYQKALSKFQWLDREMKAGDEIYQEDMKYERQQMSGEAHGNSNRRREDEDIEEFLELETGND